jgi:hypothetical protein
MAVFPIDLVYWAGQVTGGLILDLDIECPQCRGRQFIRTANPRKDERVTCVNCACEYAYGILEDRALQSAREMLVQAFPTMSLD